MAYKRHINVTIDNMVLEALQSRVKNLSGWFEESAQVFLTGYSDNKDDQKGMTKEKILEQTVVHLRQQLKEMALNLKNLNEKNDELENKLKIGRNKYNSLRKPHHY